MKSILTKAVLLFSVILIEYSCSKDEKFWSAFIPETDEQPTAAGVVGFVFRPVVVPASAVNIARLKVPEGFTVNKFAGKLGQPRILVVNTTGDVYTSDREAGLVILMKDTNH